MKSSRARLALAAVAVLAMACRKHDAPTVDPDWNRDAAATHTGPASELAPSWPAVARELAANGALVYWLHEPHTPTAHVRLLLPTGPLPGALDLAASTTAAHALLSAARHLLRRANATAELVAAPGRVELVVHAETRELEDVAAALGHLLAQPPGSERVRAARGQAALGLPNTAATSAALARTGLLAAPPILAREALLDLPEATALQAWRDLTRPEQAVLVVHAGHAHDPAWTARITERWTAKARTDAPDSAIARLRPPLPSPPIASGALGTATPAAVIDAGGTGSATLVLLRWIPTPDATARAHARLVERVLQTELDAVLLPWGPRALLLLRIPLGRSAPARVASTVAKLVELVDAPPSSLELAEHARRYLGARLVQASLDGEDLTALWSAALDLADRDEAALDALAAEASALLSIDAASHARHLREWVDPRSARGWSRILVGGDATTRKQLAAAPSQDVGREKKKR